MLRSVAVVSILASLTGSTAFGVDASDPPATVAPLAVAAPSTSEPLTTSTASAIPSVTSDSNPTSSLASTSTSTTMVELTSARVPIAQTPEATDTEFGGVVSFSVGAGVPLGAVPPSREDCIRTAKSSPLKVRGAYDQNLVAQMTHRVFECLSAVQGLDEVSPTSLRRWNGAAVWGFGSLAEQVAAEAVVVAYCESAGFNPRALTGSNGLGYSGLFQMGRTEMARFGDSGSSRFDPVDNAVGAANYFLFQYRNRNGWGGWSPWAVVNTNFDDEINNQVKVPVLPRFISTDPEFRGHPGPELPAWAVDPWSWEVPHWSETGCPYNGSGWPAARPLDS